MHRVQHLRRLAELRERFACRNGNIRCPRIFRNRDDVLDTLNDNEFLQRYRMTRLMFYDLLGQIRDDIIQNEITRLQQLSSYSLSCTS